jgi:hypothetical protein
MKIKFIYLFFGLLFSVQMKSQTPQDIEKIGYLFSDALFFSNQYVIPATDAMVYQSSAAQISSPKKAKLWETKISLNGNGFIVPNSDRNFRVSNADFKFFQIQNANSAQVQTALGTDNQIVLIGDISGQQVKLKTPKGIDNEVIVYPYLQASVGLPFGTELIAKYTYRVQLKKADFQIYGFGLKHNVSQYLSFLQSKNINLAYFIGYAKEDISFEFLDVNTPIGTLGINEITGLVDTYNIQLSASKEFKKWEVKSSILVNKSYFNYVIDGPKGTIEETLPAQDLVNKLLDDIEQPKINLIAEVGVNYNFSKHFNLTSALTFGKFINTNLGIQYKIN